MEVHVENMGGARRGAVTGMVEGVGSSEGV